ncbi:MAG: cardiolipin synthase [Clostridium sp.]|nr:cardiolipin synthase [Clostridium sp.]
MSLASVMMRIILTINFILTIVVIYGERKKPSETGIWVLIFTFLPVIGFIAYLFLGRTLHFSKKKRFRIKKEYDENYKKNLINQKKLLKTKEMITGNKIDASYYDIIEMHINESKSILTEDNDITLFIDGKEKYEALIKDIKNAKNSIHILYFIIKNDNIGKKIVNLLAQKAKEGVEVCVLYDHLGSFMTPFSAYKPLIKAGGKVNRFFPLKFGSYLRANYRNHRKIVVIDGKIGYLGGMNIGDEYMGLGKNKVAWRDTHIRLEGSSVLMLQVRFMQDWYHSSSENIKNEDMFNDDLFPKINSNGKMSLQIVSSGPDSQGEQIKRGLIKMINSAHETVYLQTPYFIPDEPFLEALQIAVMSGKDVRVMIPGIPDKPIVYRVTFSYIQDLLNYGIKVYLYPGFLHSKMLVIDDKICSLGTTNIDIRSFKLDFEINAFIYDEEFSSKCSEAFKNDMKISKEVTIDWYKKRSFFNKFQEGFFRLFSSLM